MGFWDFIKNFVPDINFNIDNRKTVITNSTVITGGQRINDPKIVDAVLDKLAEFRDKESLPCHVVHKEIADEFLEYEELNLNKKVLFDKLKGLLPEEDLKCILMALRVKELYDKDHDKGRALSGKLIKEFPNKGHKIYNLIGGGYFEEMLIPFIEVFKNENLDNYQDRYRKFYDDMIKFFPLAVFVGNGTTLERVKSEVTQRLNLTGVPFVRIHAFGQNNVEKIERAVTELKIKENYTVNNNTFASTNGLKAQIYEIKIIH